MATVSTYEGEHLVHYTVHAGRHFVVKYIPKQNRGVEYEIALRESMLNDYIDGLSIEAIEVGVCRDVKDLSIVEELS